MTNDITLARSLRAALLAPALCAAALGAMACRDPLMASGTAFFVEVEYPAEVTVQQFRFTIDRTGDAVTAPEEAGEPRPSPQTIRLLLPDELDGKEATVTVEGLQAGVVVARGSAAAQVRGGYEVKVTVAIAAPPQECSAATCEGCCEGTTCAPGDSLTSCGAAGATCSPCPEGLADTCEDGSCRCGTGAVCESGQRCESGACVCDAATCPDGCCEEGRCISPSLQSCGAAGSACAPCDADKADTCATDGACLCGSDPACGEGQRCSGGVCVCDGQSCPDGCCDDATCLPGDADSACGAGGAACQMCPSGESCSAGVCSGCDSSTCNGCCSGATCNPASPATCGVNAGACTACNALRADTCSATGACQCGTSAPCAEGQRCVDGACICDSVSCAGGCCANNSCIPGNTVNSCGSGGAACIKCAGSDRCVSGQCRCGSAQPCNGLLCLAGLCV